MTGNENSYLIVTCTARLKFVKLLNYQNETVIGNIIYFSSRFSSGKEVIKENGRDLCLSRHNVTN
jgi:hypothetical protein